MQQNSNLYPNYSSFDEPLNVLNDYVEAQKNALGFWSVTTVTER